MSICVGLEPGLTPDLIKANRRVNHRRAAAWIAVEQGIPSVAPLRFIPFR